jgi:hypothetical protein
MPPAKRAAAPKKATKVRAGRKMPDDEHAAAAAATTQSADSPDNVCGPILAKVHDAVKAITMHPMFTDIVDADPMGLETGGAMAKFSQDDFKMVLSGGSAPFYKANGNFFWQSFTWLANHRIPINLGKIREMERFNLKFDDPPSTLDWSVVVAVDSTASEVTKMRGSLQRVSHPEPVFAVLFAMQKAVEHKCDDEVMQRWRRLALNVCFQFEVVAPGEDRFWRSQNLRQMAIEQGIVAALSTRQWVYDVVGFKLSREKEANKTFSSYTIAKLYQDRVNFAGNSEVISDSFVDSAITVWTRVLCNTKARALLEWAEENMDQFPFSTIGSLQALCDRTSTSTRMVWAVAGITDLYRMEIGAVASAVLSPDIHNTSMAGAAIPPIGRPEQPPHTSMAGAAIPPIGWSSPPNTTMGRAAIPPWLEQPPQGSSKIVGAEFGHSSCRLPPSRSS